jgi:creatinine amidohydrolase
MAEKVDGLVLPHMTYFYPGGTAIGSGTVYISPSAGGAYLKEVCRSLLRQGFRRQVLLTAHGPAHVTVQPVIREFFDETKCPIAYLDLNTFFEAAEAKGVESDFNKMIWGAYGILGRLDDINPEPVGVKRAQYPEPLAKLQQGRAGVGFFFSDETQHGWFPREALSAEQRAARAKEGAEQIDRVIETMGLDAIVANMRAHDEFTRKEVLPRYRERLP